MTNRRWKKGFSLIELLVAIIIIGVLVLVLIPVVGNRAAQARLARANSDIDALSDAMSRVAIDTGYYVRLMALNDKLYGDGIAFSRDPAVDRVEGMTDYTIPQTFFTGMNSDSNQLFIVPRTGLYATFNRTDFINNSLLPGESNYNTGVLWGGPYINWRVDNNLFAGTLGRDGTPDDPWGNNYLFFTQAGLVLEPQGTLVTTTGPAANGGLQQGGPFDCEVFDRGTILSMGPNGLPGNGVAGSTLGDFGLDDDLYRSFGQ